MDTKRWQNLPKDGKNCQQLCKIPEKMAKVAPKNAKNWEKLPKHLTFAIK